MVLRPDDAGGGGGAVPAAAAVCPEGLYARRGAGDIGAGMALSVAHPRHLLSYLVLRHLRQHQPDGAGDRPAAQQHHRAAFHQHRGGAGVLCGGPTGAGAGEAGCPAAEELCAGHAEPAIREPAGTYCRGPAGQARCAPPHRAAAGLPPAEGLRRHAGVSGSVSGDAARRPAAAILRQCRRQCRTVLLCPAGGGPAGGVLREGPAAGVYRRR